ncbi:MAG: hypothetical protein CVU00_12640 [Bacteroidetes bacterium HGW-Bacteroidetes-17]|nr:MAG: hypothetical protein CVU00_12640 [Bacteroidetes bacterium HGW-Bacteroidetes-17]
MLVSNFYTYFTLDDLKLHDINLLKANYLSFPLYLSILHLLLLISIFNSIFAPSKKNQNL